MLLSEKVSWFIDKQYNGKYIFKFYSNFFKIGYFWNVMIKVDVYKFIVINIYGLDVIFKNEVFIQFNNKKKKLFGIVFNYTIDFYLFKIVFQKFMFF